MLPANAVPLCIAMRRPRTMARRRWLLGRSAKHWAIAIQPWRPCPRPPDYSPRCSALGDHVGELDRRTRHVLGLGRRVPLPDRAGRGVQPHVGDWLRYRELAVYERPAERAHPDVADVADAVGGLARDLEEVVDVPGRVPKSPSGGPSPSCGCPCPGPNQGARRSGSAASEGIAEAAEVRTPTLQQRWPHQRLGLFHRTAAHAFIPPRAEPVWIRDRVHRPAVPHRGGAGPPS